MPSCASSDGLSNGEDVNSAAVGDMSPNESAESTSVEGWSGAMANSIARGEAIDLVGVTASSSLSIDAGASTMVVLVSGLSGSTTLRTGMTCPEGST